MPTYLPIRYDSLRDVAIDAPNYNKTEFPKLFRIAIDANDDKALALW
jgi:hypothetical protein